MLTLEIFCFYYDVRNFKILTAGSEKLKQSPFLKTFCGENELNAFARSKKIAAVFFPFSWFSITVSVKKNTASVEDLFVLEHKLLIIQQIVFIVIIIWKRRSFSKSLAKAGVTEIGR